MGGGVEGLLLAPEVDRVHDQPPLVPRVREEVQLAEGISDELGEELPGEPLGLGLVLAELEHEPRGRPPRPLLPRALHAQEGGELEARSLELVDDLGDVDATEEALDTEHRAAGVGRLGLVEFVRLPPRTDRKRVPADALGLGLMLRRELRPALRSALVLAHSSRLEPLVPVLVQINLEQEDVRPRCAGRVRAMRGAVHVFASRHTTADRRPARHRNRLGTHGTPSFRKMSLRNGATNASPATRVAKRRRYSRRFAVLKPIII